MNTFLQFEEQEYKRRQAAPIIRVSPRAFGIGRRVAVIKPAFRAIS